MLKHLAVVIDLREERLEKTTIPFLRQQISAQLEVLLKRFEAEYRAFLLATGQQDTAADLLKSAA